VTCRPLAGRNYDVVIIGGGITGACIARDAAMRGPVGGAPCKGDFAGATTAASSKTLPWWRGCDNLLNLELGLVRESLKERKIWSNIAPHLVDPLTFVMPINAPPGRSGVMKGHWPDALRSPLL